MPFTARQYLRMIAVVSAITLLTISFAAGLGWMAMQVTPWIGISAGLVAIFAWVFGVVVPAMFKAAPWVFDE